MLETIFVFLSLSIPRGSFNDFAVEFQTFHGRPFVGRIFHRASVYRGERHHPGRHVIRFALTKWSTDWPRIYSSFRWSAVAGELVLNPFCKRARRKNERREMRDKRNKGEVKEGKGKWSSIEKKEGMKRHPCYLNVQYLKYHGWTYFWCFINSLTRCAASCVEYRFKRGGGGEEKRIEISTRFPWIK